MRTVSTACRLAAMAVLAVSGATQAQFDEELVVTPEAFVYCTVCHGMQLMGNREIDAPRLSQMEPWHVEQQLQSFKKGWRGKHGEDLIGMEMQPMAAALTDQQIADAAEYVSETRSPIPAPTIDGDADAGKRHFTTCAACHGVNAEGNEALGAPALTGLNDWYLVRQLANYMNGARGGDPADIYGQQMRASTTLLGNDEAIRDVVKYITTLPTKERL